MLIETTDLSPILHVGSAEDAWLRQLAQSAKTGSLILRLSGADNNDADEPLLSFDARTGMWWTGRYVGELRFHDSVLRILPRFGVPQLQRWLSRIWGVRIISSQGRYEQSRVWLWQLLARLWEARLLAAAKHGLPTRRVDEAHVGSTVRGRLDVRKSARELYEGTSGSSAAPAIARSTRTSRQSFSALTPICAPNLLISAIHAHGLPQERKVPSAPYRMLSIVGSRFLRSIPRKRSATRPSTRRIARLLRFRCRSCASGRCRRQPKEPVMFWAS